MQPIPRHDTFAHFPGVPPALPTWVDTCALADLITIPTYRLGLLNNAVILRSVSREIVTLQTDSAPHKREAGAQAAKTLAALHGMSHVTVTLDDAEPSGEPTDDELIARVAQSQGQLVTRDRDLQQRAEQRGVCVVRVQDLHRLLRPVALELRHVFPTPETVQVGDRLSVFLSKTGNRANDAMAYLGTSSLVFVREAKHLVGQEVEVEVKQTRQSPDGQEIVTSDLVVPVVSQQSA